MLDSMHFVDVLAHYFVNRQAERLKQKYGKANMLIIKFYCKSFTQFKIKSSHCIIDTVEVVYNKFHRIDHIRSKGEKCSLIHQVSYALLLIWNCMLIWRSKLWLCHLFAEFERFIFNNTVSDSFISHFSVNEKLTQIIFICSHFEWSWKVGVVRFVHVVTFCSIFLLECKFFFIVDRNFIFGKLFRLYLCVQKLNTIHTIRNYNNNQIGSRFLSP